MHNPKFPLTFFSSARPFMKTEIRAFGFRKTSSGLWNASGDSPAGQFAMAPSEQPASIVPEEWISAVYRFALRLAGDVHAAEDLTQETMLRAWRNRDRIREPRALRVLLFRIAANAWRDQLRRKKSRVARTCTLPEDVPEQAALPEDILAGEENHKLVLEMLDSLPDRQREVFYLSVCEELCSKEIAGVLGISRDAVKSNLSLARKRMREILKTQHHD
jgi:RNA polymerase sigma-70 factor (ECF subfamily)